MIGCVGAMCDVLFAARRDVARRVRERRLLALMSKKAKQREARARATSVARTTPSLITGRCIATVDDNGLHRSTAVVVRRHCVLMRDECREAARALRNFSSRCCHFGVAMTTGVVGIVATIVV
jgi:hypothetical protein